MERFSVALARLTEKFIADVAAAVEAAAFVTAERAATTPPRRLPRPKPRQELRAPEPAVVVSSFDIPVGRARTQRARPRRQVAPSRQAAAPTPSSSAAVLQAQTAAEASASGPDAAAATTAATSATGPAPAPSPTAAPEQVVKFEVVPHPERANRRMVLTRLNPT